MTDAEISQDNESKILRLALNDKRIAVAVLGQALLDEGGIGAQSITVFYTSKSEAVHLWKIADSLGYANAFGKKKHRNHYNYGFSIKASKRKELYSQIGPLPNPAKDKVFRHLANRCLGKNLRGRGETRTLILQSLVKDPKTVLQLMLDTNTSASTVRRHLSNLRNKDFVKIIGKDKGAFQKSLRTADLWSAIHT